MRIRISRERARFALALLPLTAVLGALLWPATSGVAAGVVVAATPSSAPASASPSPSGSPCLVPGSPLCPSPSTSPSTKPSTRPSTSPTARPTVRPTAGGGPSHPTPPSTTNVPPAATTPVDPGSLVGHGSGPPTPPAVPGSRVDIQADPQKPGPGESTVLTITVSGSRGSDRYAVPAAAIDVQLTEKPDGAATLSATSLTTDVSGSAMTRLTLSTTKGRHVVTATSSGISSRLVFDTLAGTTANAGRARHSAGVITTTVPPLIEPAYLFMAAGFFLVGGFLLPYRRRVLSRLRRRGGPPAAPEITAEPAADEPAPAGTADPRVSSGRKPRAARRSAAPGG